ncbi:unnamed protein product [Nesidiocoris tenuis]|uniref:Uncharacterized protein n=1 Tax=Nesidiocoris tenuis TaxID=355587 RepID=A0A6H5GDF9_9HEMI|nr:unnamed protein product [Nesidiocoris tenuis]
MVANLPFLLQYLPRQSLRAQDKYHRRCSSFPDAAMQRTPSTSLWSSKSTVGQSRGQELKELNERCLQSEPSVPVVESEIAEEVTADDGGEEDVFDLQRIKRELQQYQHREGTDQTEGQEGETRSWQHKFRRERGDHPKQLQPSYAHRQEEEILHGGRRQFDQADVDRSLPAEADHRTKPDGISQLQSPPGNFRLHCRAGPGKRPFLRFRSHHRRHRAGEISSVAFFARRPFGNSDFPCVPGQM